MYIKLGRFDANLSHAPAPNAPLFRVQTESHERGRDWYVRLNQWIIVASWLYSSTAKVSA